MSSKKIRDLKTQVNEARQNANSIAEQGLRFAGAGDIYPLPVSEPQRSYMWELVFLGDSTNFENLRLYAKSATITQSSVETITKYYNGIPINYAGKDASSHEFTATFWDNQDLDVYRFFQEWMNIINNPSYGLQVGKNKYTKRIKLRLKDNTDLFTTGDFYFTRAFPSEVSDISLDYDDSNAVEVSVTFMFDHKYPGKEQEGAFSSYFQFENYTDSFTGDFESVIDQAGNLADNIADFF